MKTRAWFGLSILILALLLVACSGPTPGGTQPPGGTLDIDIEGLPAGVDAFVKVFGPPDFVQTVVSSEALTGLIPGNYQVLAYEVMSNSIGYDVSPASTEVIISTSGGDRVVVRYEEVLPKLTSDAAPPDAETTAALIGFTPLSPGTSNSETVPFPENSGGTLEFNSDTPFLQQLEVGKVVAFEVTNATPYGFIGRVTDMLHLRTVEQSERAQRRFGSVQIGS